MGSKITRSKNYSTTIDGSDDDRLEKLFESGSSELFSTAREMAKGKQKILCSPSIINAYCMTEPECRHCKWRSMKKERKNFTSKRSLEEVVRRAVELEKEGINRIFLPSGWMGYELPDYFYDYVQAVRNAVDTEIFGLFGAVDGLSLLRLKNAGMDGYLCGIESPNNKVYMNFRPGGDTLEKRIETLYHAKELGLKVWTGFLYGLGETKDDIKWALKMFRDVDADSVSILPFEPFPDTDMESCDPPNLYEWARVLAVTKIFLGNEVNMFVQFSNQNYHSFGLHAGANGFYFFPGSRP